MDALAVYFSGEHPLSQNVKHDELHLWFRSMQAKIDELGGAFGTPNGEDSAMALQTQFKYTQFAFELRPS